MGGCTWLNSRGGPHLYINCVYREANCDVILFDQNTNPEDNPQAAESVQNIELKGKKNRKKLSGHLSKVYALQWNEDSR